MYELVNETDHQDLYIWFINLYNITIPDDRFFLDSLFFSYKHLLLITRITDYGIVTASGIRYTARFIL